MKNCAPACMLVLCFQEILCNSSLNFMYRRWIIILKKRLNFSENSLNWMSDPSKEREFHLCQILDFDQSINQCLATFVLSFFHGFCLFIWLWRCKGQQQIKLIRCRSIEMTRSKIERRLLVKNNKEVQSFWRDLLSRFICQFLHAGQAPSFSP